MSSEEIDDGWRYREVKLLCQDVVVSMIKWCLSDVEPVMVMRAGLSSCGPLRYSATTVDFHDCFHDIICSSFDLTPPGMLN